MRVPFSRLKEFVCTELSVESIAEALTLAGLEVESIERRALLFEGVVVATVLDTQRHPDAEKLTVAQVSDGTRIYTVVCGASNCRPGIYVALARVGAVLHPEGKALTIKTSKLRGIESQGMLCSADELGLPGRHQGILELPSDWTLGADLKHYYQDPVLHLGLTPNLGHGLSILGIAREVAAITRAPLVLRPCTIREEGPPIQFSVDIQHDSCLRYACRVLDKIKIGPSPAWLQESLEAAGMRSVNNVVDVTNWVMIELGQPLHAFDLHQVAGKQIIVRMSKPGESLTTLDGLERELHEKTLLICDAHKPLAIAGVMGCSRSEVGESTTAILLEAASFDPATIRRSSKHLHLQTEASKRFERGCDPKLLLSALDRAAQLIVDIAGGSIAAGVVDHRTADLPCHSVSLRVETLNQILGTHLSMSEVEELLHRLQCAVSTDNQVLTVLPPSYRSDLRLEVDLIEEVGRLYGYGNIVRKASTYQPGTIPHTPLFLLERKLRAQLVGLGLQEVVTCNLISPRMVEDALAVSDPQSIISVLNPASVEQSVLRPSLVPSLLQVVKNNANQNLHDLSIFEIGRVHYRTPQEFAEQTELGIILTGTSKPPHWDVTGRNVDFFDLKGMIESILVRFGIQGVRFERGSLPNFHPGRQARLMFQDRAIGFVGEVHPSRQRAWDLRHPVLYAELNLTALLQYQTRLIQYDPLPQFPGTFRDWTVRLSEEVPVGELLRIFETMPSRLLKKVMLTTIYRGDAVHGAWKNVTFRFTYRDDRKTLSMEAVEIEHQRIIKHTEAYLKENYEY